MAGRWGEPTFKKNVQWVYFFPMQDVPFGRSPWRMESSLQLEIDRSRLSQICHFPFCLPAPPFSVLFSFLQPFPLFFPLLSQLSFHPFLGHIHPAILSDGQMLSCSRLAFSLFTFNAAFLSTAHRLVTAKPDGVLLVIGCLIEGCRS